MNNDVDMWIPYIIKDSKTKCVLINPDRFVKEYYWSGADIGDLTDALDSSYTKVSNLRQRRVLNFTVLYDKNEQVAEDFASIFVNDEPIIYGPCIIFRENMTSLTDKEASELCIARCLCTYNGSTTICVKLEKDRPI